MEGAFYAPFFVYNLSKNVFESPFDLLFLFELIVCHGKQ